MMLSFAHALPLQKQENPQVYRLVENVAIAAGLPMPKVYIVDDESLNAFATGRDPKHASIALTTGIIAKLEPLELEGVIAHEMAHIGNRDIRLNMMIITGLSVFAFLAEMIGRSLRYSTSSSKDSGKFKILLLAIMLALLVFNFLWLRLSRWQFPAHVNTPPMPPAHSSPATRRLWPRRSKNFGRCEG